jgi:hypothetical protein
MVSEKRNASPGEAGVAGFVKNGQVTDNPHNSHSVIALQVARLRRRFAIGDELALVVASHAYPRSAAR